MSIDARRVVARFVAAAAARLSPKVRSAGNMDLIRAGLDGNGRFKSPGEALGRASEVLAKHGMEWGEVINAFSLRPPQGNLNIDLALSNPTDPFSPMDISNSVLAVQWYQLDSGQYEVVAYLS